MNPAGAPELRPRIDEATLLIEDLHAVVIAIRNEDPPLGVERDLSAGWLKSPGPAPVCPQAMTNVPSDAYFTTRLLIWPSATKMSPLSATATSEMPSKVYGPLPATPGVPIVINHFALWAELDNDFALASLVAGIGHPYVALAVDVQAREGTQTSLPPSSSAARLTD